MELLIIIIFVLGLVIYQKKKKSKILKDTNENLVKSEKMDVQSSKIDIQTNENNEKTLYIDSFNSLQEYDINKELSQDFLQKLVSLKELDYETYTKIPGTTKRPESFVVFDLETTGLSPINSEIIEIGAIKFEDGKPIEKFHTYVKPKKKISSKITNINGITNEMVANAPEFEFVIPKFIDFIGENVLIAHNASFDMSFILENMYKLTYKKLKNKVIDTLKLSRQKIREYDMFDEKDVKLENYKLETLKNAFYLSNLPSHNALDDCKVCAYVYLKILQQDGEICYVYN